MECTTCPNSDQVQRCVVRSEGAAFKIYIDQGVQFIQNDIDIVSADSCGNLRALWHISHPVDDRLPLKTCGGQRCNDWRVASKDEG